MKTISTKNPFTDKSDIWHLYINRLIEKSHSVNMDHFSAWIIDKILVPAVLRGNKESISSIAESIGLKKTSDVGKIYWKLHGMNEAFEMDSHYKF